MPFSPLCPDHGPIGYVAGAFLGDGSELSDRLVRFDADSATSTNAVWDGDRWLDPATGIPSLMTAKPGDTLFLLRYDADPFGLYAFGRAASHLAPFSPPYFSSLFVDSTNATVSLGVSAATLPYDILSADSTNAVAPGTGWLHLGRSASDCIWFDDAPPAGFVRRYLVSDATRTAMVSPTHWKSTSTAHRRFLRIRTATVSRTDSKSPGVRIRLSQTKAYRMLGRKGSSFRTSVQA